jgi:hypothetical protein
MKHLKMLGLFVMAAAALMAFAGSASAATFTAPAGTEYTGSVDASLESGTTALLKAGFAEITCTSSTVKGTLTTNSETEASGPLTSTKNANGDPEGIEFGGCGSATVTTLSVGSLKILKSNTEVKAINSEVTTAVLGTSCVYGGSAAGTKLGTASNTASGVTLNITAQLERKSGGFLCANPAEWTAKYLVTTPTGSVVD